MSKFDFSFSWEFAFAIIIMVCATVALMFSDFSSDNWIHVLTLIISFLTGMGYGYVRHYLKTF